MNVVSITVPDQVSLRVYMTDEKRRRFKMLTAAKGSDMSAVANDLIDRWMAEVERELQLRQPNQDDK